MDHFDCDQRLMAIGKELMKDINNPDAWAAKADILYSLGMFEIAIRCCDRSLALEPNNMLTWITKGNALDKLGRHEEAKEAFSKACLLKETNP